MGVADLRDAFNAVAQPRFSASSALLDYTRANDTEWQVLTFSGIGADGLGFSIKSDRVRPNGNLILAARATAQALLAKEAPKP